jgi:hypothetical protein
VSDWRRQISWIREVCLTKLDLVPGSMAAESTTVTDYETGFTFSQYQAKFNVNGGGVLYRVAVPSTAANGADFETVVQIIAPKDLGWAGLAWGGSMLNNPLTVVWADGRGGVTLSSRMARSVNLFDPHPSATTSRLTSRFSSHSQPQPYSGATYEIFKTGTHANSSHWQVTAKCTGCAAYTSGSSRSTRRLNPKGQNQLAFATSPQKPAQPANPNSTFPLHDVQRAWYHDFAPASNPQFATLVAKNGGKKVKRGTQILRTARRRIPADTVDEDYE